MHQLADYSIRIRVVRGDEADAERNIEEAVDRIRRRIENEVPVSIEYVDALPYTGGKTKYIISDVAVT
jgi:phenylacetate-CoA ligase